MVTPKKRIGRYRLRLVDGRFREGALIDLPDGRRGDAAPLPGWSSETLDETLAWLRNPQGEPPASAQAALEMGEAGAPLRRTVPINALLTGGEREIIHRGAAALGAGCGCLKIKAKALDPRQVFHIAAELSKAGAAIFRIDPNRAWDLETTRAAAKLLEPFPVEYFEEPVAASQELKTLIADGVPVALDETLREISPERLAEFRGAGALILKPTLMGGYRVCRQFAARGRDLGMKAVVSACYESGVGIDALGRFAASLPEISAAGLDTYQMLAEDVLVTRLDFSGYTFTPGAEPPEIADAKLVF